MSRDYLDTKETQVGLAKREFPEFPVKRESEAWTEFLVDLDPSVRPG